MEAASLLDGIVESVENRVVILSPSWRRPYRRVLYINSYGGGDILTKVKARSMPGHHLWGCLELVRMGYEVALADPLPHFYLHRRPFPHDLKLLRIVRDWLGNDGIIYCAHTLLYWLPFLKSLHAIKLPIVSLTYAREHLDFARAHTGIIALTPAAADQAKKMAPKAKVAHLSWGTDLRFVPVLSYRPDWFFSCGITHRDFKTLSLGAAACRQRIRVICPGLPADVSWPPNVDVADGGSGWNFEKTAVSYRELLYDYYAGCSASLIILKNDPTEYTAVGFTNLIEAMSIARPVIVTRTGALPSEIDVERAGCGLHVPPEDPVALGEAIEALASDRKRAEAMGKKGRQLAESKYNINRYAVELHQFLESL
jgi:glycosyltransferase involved in cell wall biosynthesis